MGHTYGVVDFSSLIEQLEAKKLSIHHHLDNLGTNIYSIINKNTIFRTPMKTGMLRKDKCYTEDKGSRMTYTVVFDAVNPIDHFRYAEWLEIHEYPEESYTTPGTSHHFLSRGFTGGITFSRNPYGTINGTIYNEGAIGDIIKEIEFVLGEEW